MAFLGGPVNFVTHVLKSNCNAPLWVYFRTAIPAFIDAWWLLRTWTFMDLVRARGKNIAGGGSPRTGRGLGHSKFNRGAIPPQGKKTWSQAGLSHLLRFTDPLEKIGFVMLMYGAVNQFYYDWLWYLDISDTCDPDREQYFERSVEDGQVFPNAGGNGIFLTDLVVNTGSWDNSSLGITLPIGYYSGALCITITGPGGGAFYECELRWDGTWGKGVISSGTVFAADGEDVDLVLPFDKHVWSLTGGGVRWFVKGPPVPVGLRVPKAGFFVKRSIVNAN